MKKQLLKTSLLTAITLLFFACSGGAGEKSADAETETDVTEESEAAVTAETAGTDISQIFVAWHEVADYDAWKIVYEGNSDNIHAGGMTELALGREDDNPNNVFVGHIVNDIDAAREFTQSEDLKAKMEEGGVSEPEIMTFIDVVSYGRPYREILARVMIRHKVADWDSWKVVFDSEAEAIEEAGLFPLFLGRDTDDGNMVTVVNIIHDMEKAEAYINSEGLKEKMGEAGVEGEVDIKFYSISEYAEVI